MEVEVTEFEFVCPVTKRLLVRVGDDRLETAEEPTVAYRRVDGIWRFLPPERAAHYAQFLREYETIREAEERGSDDPAYYRALPFQDLTGRHTAAWKIRAQGFKLLGEEVVFPLEQARERPLKILDVGAGNGWLSYSLAQLGHQLAAVDLVVNEWDGLGAHRHYDADFVPIQAEFNQIPLADGQFDAVVYNASLHYSADYETTLREGLRLLRPDGRLAIVDTPVYKEAENGRQMVQEREAEFKAKYGFPSNAIASENFLTYGRIEALAQKLGVEFTLAWYSPSWRRALRRWRRQRRGQREAGQFPLIVGKQSEASLRLAQDMA